MQSVQCYTQGQLEVGPKRTNVSLNLNNCRYVIAFNFGLITYTTENTKPLTLVPLEHQQQDALMNKN